MKAKLKIEVLAEGWNEIPLRLADAAITAATLDGKPARIVGEPGQDYQLLVEKKGKEPEPMELALEYARAISRMPGQNSVSFQAPQAPVSRWRVVIPQAGVKVNLQPLIAATEVPAEKKPDGRQAAKKTPDETVVLAFVGAAPMVRIDWTPKAEGATGLAALASVQAEQQVWITEGVVRTTDDAGLLDQPGRTGPTGDRRAGRPEGGQRLRRQCPPVVGRAGRRPAADHRPVVRAGQGLAEGDGRVGEVRRPRS